MASLVSAGTWERWSALMSARCPPRHPPQQHPGPRGEHHGGQHGSARSGPRTNPQRLGQGLPAPRWARQWPTLKRGSGPAPPRQWGKSVQTANPGLATTVMTPLGAARHDEGVSTAPWTVAPSASQNHPDGEHTATACRGGQAHLENSRPRTPGQTPTEVPPRHTQTPAAGPTQPRRNNHPHCEQRHGDVGRDQRGTPPSSRPGIGTGATRPP